MTKPEIDAEGLLPCPFCGATPHRGLTKMQHDQLHGEPFQRYRVWCPHGCANIDQMNEAAAISAWNRRAATRTSEAAEPVTVPERQQAWAALRMIADAVGELFGPAASIESEDASLLRGPEYHHFAEGIVEALQRAAPHPSPVSEEVTDEDVLKAAMAIKRVFYQRMDLGPEGDKELTLLDAAHLARAALASLRSAKP